MKVYLLSFVKDIAVLADGGSTQAISSKYFYLDLVSFILLVSTWFFLKKTISLKATINYALKMSYRSFDIEI